MAPATDESGLGRRLLFAPELAAGEIRLSQLARREVREATVTTVVPSSVSRAYQQRLLRTGRLGYEQTTVPTAMAARTAVLGDAAAGPPRLLVRIDAPLEHPAHARLAAAGLPTLVAAPGRRLGDSELAGVAEVRRGGGTVALDIELVRDVRRLEASVTAGIAALAAHALTVDTGVARAPTWPVWPVLARHLKVVCGDPASVRSFGYHDTPQARGRAAVWLPAWPPLAGPADQALAAVRRLADAGAALWVPVLLDGDDPGLDAFAAGAAAWVRPWQELIAAVDDSPAGDKK